MSLKPLSQEENEGYLTKMMNNRMRIKFRTPAELNTSILIYNSFLLFTVYMEYSDLASLEPCKLLFYRHENVSLHMALNLVIELKFTNSSITRSARKFQLIISRSDLYVYYGGFKLMTKKTYKRP